MRQEIAFENQLVYTVDEVAQALKVNRGTIYDLIQANVLKTIKLGRQKVTRKSLLEFLDKYDGHDLSDVRAITEINHAIVE